MRLLGDVAVRFCRRGFGEVRLDYLKKSAKLTKNDGEMLPDFCFAKVM